MWLVFKTRWLRLLFVITGLVLMTSLKVIFCCSFCFRFDTALAKLEDLFVKFWKLSVLKPSLLWISRMLLRNLMTVTEHRFDPSKELGPDVTSRLLNHGNRDNRVPELENRAPDHGLVKNSVVVTRFQGKSSLYSYTECWINSSCLMFGKLSSVWSGREWVQFELFESHTYQQVRLSYTSFVESQHNQLLII